MILLENNLIEANSFLKIFSGLCLNCSLLVPLLLLAYRSSKCTLGLYQRNQRLNSTSRFASHERA